jgi:hypothetical protein
VFEQLSAPKALTSVTMQGKDGLADSADLAYLKANSGSDKIFLHTVTGLKTGKHTFDYNLNGFTLPYNDTQGTDHWGYWNGNLVSNLRNHLAETAWMTDPDLEQRSASHLYDQTVDNAKEANASYSVCGALTTIHYPHGGTTTVTYEPNRVTRRMNARSTQTARFLEPVDSLDLDASWIVGGVRVKTLTDTDGLGNADTTRFSYVNPDQNGRGSGILMVMPKYAQLVHYRQRVSSTFEYHSMTGVSTVNAVGFNNCCGFVLDRDPHVVYPDVVVIHSDGSSTEHRFTSVANDALMDGYVSLGGIVKRVFGPNDGIEYDGQAPTCMIPASLDSKNLRGLPLRTIVRNAAGTELKRTEQDYAYYQVSIPYLCFNNILTFSLAGYTVRSPRLVSARETERGVTVRTDKAYNAYGQVSVATTAQSSGVAADDTLRVRLRYRHETGDTSRFRTLLDAAAKTRIHGAGEFLLDREHYSYIPGTPRLGGIVAYHPDTPVALTTPSGLFSVQAGPGRVSSFDYDGLYHLTQASFPGGAYITYTWDGNNISSKTENNTDNVTLFFWKDLVGLTGVTSPSGLAETYQYDSRNRPWKTRDANSRVVSMFNYHLKNE